MYINQKLSSRPIIASHNILTFQKGQFTINKKGRRTLVLWYGFVQTILKLQENGCFRNIGIRNSLSEWYDITEKYLYTILPVFLLVLWVHIAQMKAFSHSNILKTYCFRDIISLRGACCKFQYCGNTHFPAISILSGQNHIIVQGCACLFFVNCELIL